MLLTTGVDWAHLMTNGPTELTFSKDPCGSKRLPPTSAIRVSVSGNGTSHEGVGVGLS